MIDISGSTIRLSSSAETGKNKEFTFDQCYGIDSNQQQVYDDLGLHIIEKALEGYNGTIFAYGNYSINVYNYIKMIM